MIDFDVLNYFVKFQYFVVRMKNYINFKLIFELKNLIETVLWLSLSNDLK